MWAAGVTKGVCGPEDVVGTVVVAVLPGTDKVGWAANDGDGTKPVVLATAVLEGTWAAEGVAAVEAAGGGEPPIAFGTEELTVVPAALEDGLPRPPVAAIPLPLVPTAAGVAGVAPATGGFPPGVRPFLPPLVPFGGGGSSSTSSFGMAAT